MELNNLTTTALKAAMQIVLGRNESERYIDDLIDVIEFVAEKGEEVTIGDLLNLRQTISGKTIQPNLSRSISAEEVLKIKEGIQEAILKMPSFSREWPTIHYVPTVGDTKAALNRANTDGIHAAHLDNVQLS